MGDELKSAYELAMEKLGGAEKKASLTDEQKARIESVRETARAERAEKQILKRAALESARAAGDAEKYERLNEEYDAELEDIVRREQDAVAAIRSASEA